MNKRSGSKRTISSWIALVMGILMTIGWLGFMYYPAEVYGEIAEYTEKADSKYRIAVLGMFLIFFWVMWDILASTIIPLYSIDVKGGKRKCLRKEH